MDNTDIVSAIQKLQREISNDSSTLEDLLKDILKELKNQNSLLDDIASNTSRIT